MADGFTLKFDVEPNKASVQQSAQEIQATLENRMNGSSVGDKFMSDLHNSISKGLGNIGATGHWIDGNIVFDNESIQKAFGKIMTDARQLGEDELKVMQTQGSGLPTFEDTEQKMQSIGGAIGGVLADMQQLAESGQRWTDAFAEDYQYLQECLGQLQDMLGVSEQVRFNLENLERPSIIPEEVTSEQGPLSGFGSQGFIPVEALHEMENAFEGIQQSASTIPQEIAQVETELLPAKDNTAELAREMELAAKRAARIHEYFGLWGGSFSGVKTNFVKMADYMGYATSAAQKLKNVLASGIKGSIGGIIGKFKQMGTAAGKSADQASKKMKRMTLQMIKAMIGVRGLYMLFRKLRQAIKEGMDTLAQNVPEFNRVFSDFKTALNGIKGSVGSAFQPILQVVLPILTQLANALSNVLTMIAKFNAVLTGQGYIYKFTAAQQDYAKSLKGTGGAAKKATKDLMGFDEINRLSAPNEGGGGGSGGIGDYQKEMIDKASAISEFAEMVKDAWEKADFTEVGKKIGISIRDAMFDASFFLDREGQKWAKQMSSSLSTLINGMVDIPWLGHSIGMAIGSGLNVGITFLRDFWRDTNWEGIGEQLGGAINGLFNKVDWVGLGEYFAFKFNGIFDFIGGLADSTKWQNIGTDLGNGLNAIIENIDLGEATSNVSSLIVGMLESGISFITTTDWEGIGGDLAEGLEGIDWTGVLGNAGKLISKGAQGICNMVISFVKKTDWEKVSKDLIEGLEEMFSNIWDDGALIQTLAEALGGLFAAAFTVLWNIGGWIHDNCVQPLMDALESEFEQMDTGNIGLDIILGICKGISDALMNIGKWIAENIVMPFLDGICDAFGIHSPSTVMMDIGLDLIEGLFEGLKGIWDFVCGIFEDLKENILGIFEDISSGISDIWEGIKSTASTVWNGIKTTVVNIVSGIFRTVTAQFTNLKEGVLGIFRTIRDVAGMIWDGLCSVFSTVFEGIWQTLQTVFGKIAEFLDWLWQKILDIKAFFEGESLIEKMKRKNPELFEQVKVASAGGTSASVPHLATGSVLPPNSPFLAMVGDQTHGTNVEAPLDTIKQAVAEVILENNDILTMGFEAVVNAIQSKDMSVRIGDKDIAQANDRYNQRLNLMRGTV